jgi:hypothetical protein
LLLSDSLPRLIEYYYPYYIELGREVFLLKIYYYYLG